VAKIDAFVLAARVKRPILLVLSQSRIRRGEVSLTMPVLPRHFEFKSSDA
jgi:hypothetical protein